MTQERYGVRLCWTPSVKSPAFGFLQQIQSARQQVLDAARTSLPPMPTQPQPVSPGTDATANNATFWSDVFDCNQWGTFGDMRADYDLDIAYDAATYIWDGILDIVKANLQLITQRTQAAADIVGMPFATQGDKGSVLRVKVHVGSAVWVNGPGIQIQVGAQFTKTTTTTTTQDSQYADALAAYQTSLQDWNDKEADVMAKAEADADALEQTLYAQLNPVNELVKGLVQTSFPPAVRDECWEIDCWQKVFDWERASYVLYPAWWSDLPIADPTKDPVDFVNASWARLYLPVRAGMERIALRWIYGKSIEKPLAPNIEKEFDAIEADLGTYRTKNFKDPLGMPKLTKECEDVEEPYYCIAKWPEFMPTDGTHCEVILGFTTAADDLTSSEIEDAAALRKAVLDSQKQDLALKKKAADKMTAATHTEVKIKTEPGPTGP